MQTTKPRSMHGSEPLSGWPGEADERGRNVPQSERWLSLLGGGALVFWGLKNGTPAGYLAAATGGYLVYRGASGYCWLYGALGANPQQTGEGIASPLLNQSIKVEKSITIDKPVAEIYRFWRQLENLPRFMKHLESVTTIDEQRSRWVARAPFGQTVSWEAVITDDRPDELIAWRSIEGGSVETVGRVRFQPAPGNRGTEVHVRMEYKPPAGLVGAAVAKLFGEEPSQQIADDLRRLKQVIETGEVATTTGQPAGGMRADGSKPAGSDKPISAPMGADRVASERQAGTATAPVPAPTGWSAASEERPTA